MGIDIGSTSVKAALFKSGGQCIVSARKEYLIEEKKDGWTEINADFYWKSCVSVIREIKKVMEDKCIKGQGIKALAVSSQGTTFVPVGSNGVPLYNAIVWMDRRAETEAREINNIIGPEKIFGITGQPDLNANYIPPKLMWIRKNLPDIYEKTFKILCLEDYIIFKFTGMFVTEYTLASMSLLMDIRKKEWWDGILDVIGFTRDKLPEILEPGVPIGKITSRAAAETGLPESTTIVSGAFDHAAAAVGVGNIKHGLVSENTGGVLALFVSIDNPLTGNSKKLPVMCHVKKDLYYFLPWCRSAGLTIRWLLKTFYPEMEIKSTSGTSSSNFSIMDDEAASVAPGCDGLIMLPHLLGAGFPELDQAASGVFAGFRLHHTRAHFARSLFEAMGFMLKRNIENIESLGIRLNEIRSVGGGSNADLLNKIKANITEKAIRIFEVKDSGTLGCSILAGKAIGMFNSLEEGCDCMVKPLTRYEPDLHQKEIYEKNYKIYLNLYDSMKQVFKLMQP